MLPCGPNYYLLDTILQQSQPLPASHSEANDSHKDNTRQDDAAKEVLIAFKNGFRVFSENEDLMN